MARLVDPDVIYEDPSAYAKARNLGRYSRYNTIAWLAGDVWKYARLTAATIKKAMLDVGTQGYVYQFSRDRVCHRIGWWIANNVRRQLIKGWYIHY